MKKVDWELSLEEFTTIQTSLYTLAEEFTQKLCETANPNMKSFYNRKLQVITELMEKKFITKKGVNADEQIRDVADVVYQCSRET